jgi:plastocyanin
MGKTRGIAVVCLMCLLAFTLPAETIEGTVVIKRQLTKRRVTAAVPLYQRGQGVALAADSEDDLLAAERTRVVIWVDGANSLDRAATDAEGINSEIAKIEQVNRRFMPETVVVSAGGKVSFPNMDPIFHNVFSLSRPKMFDLGNYPKGETRTVAFPDPGIVYVNCHLHPNMTAVIVVTPNRWHTGADRDGKFVLPEVPPGQYSVVAWHKAAGFFRQQVQVGAGQDRKIEFLIPLGADGSRLESKR